MENDLKMSSAKWRSYCFDINVMIWLVPSDNYKDIRLYRSVRSDIMTVPAPGPRLNIKTIFPGVGISIINKYKTLVIPSNLYNGFYTDKTAFLYWDAPLIDWNI